MKSNKVVVVGIDGATWKLLDKLVTRGLMPNLKKLKEKGAWGNLESTIPPITGPAWVSFATGKNSGKHGCHNFILPQGALDDVNTISRKAIKGPTFYQYLTHKSKKPVVVNLPSSFPPVEKGIFLGSFLTKDSVPFFPKNLNNKYKELDDYRLLPNFWLEKQGRINEYIEDVLDVESKRFKVSKKLYEKESWDLFFVLISGSDWVQHKYYTRLMKGKLSNNHPAVKMYQNIDSYLGWYWKNKPKNTDMILISDHGFESYEGYFYINKWLAEEGFLSIETQGEVGRAVTEQQVLKNKPWLKLILENNSWLYRLGGSVFRSVYSHSYKILPRWLRDLGEVGLSLNLSNSKALSVPGNIGIYINDKQRFENGSVDVKDYEKVRDKLVKKMKKLKDMSGDKVFDKVWKKEDVHKGEELDKLPDIQFFSNKYLIWSGLYNPRGLYEIDDYMNGHDMHGIFLGLGPSFNSKKLNQASLLDIAPTIIYLLDEKIPDDMDGKVLEDAIKSNIVNKRKIEYVGSDNILNKEKLVNADLAQKIAKSEQILKDCLLKYDRKNTVLNWTGGKDSTLILWMMKRICTLEGIKLPKLLFIDEGDVFDEVYDFVEELTKKWLLDVRKVRNDDVYNQVGGKLGELVKVNDLNKRNKKELKRLGYKEKGFKFEPESLVGNHLMKTVAMNEFLEKNKIEAVITGIRWDEQEARADETFFSPRKSPDHMRIHPILHMTEKDLWEITHMYDIPYNKLYKEGYRSLGVKSTTEKASSKPAWEQDLLNTTERVGRRQDKENVMGRLRDLGYM